MQIMRAGWLLLVIFASACHGKRAKPKSLGPIITKVLDTSGVYTDRACAELEQAEKAGASLTNDPADNPEPHDLADLILARKKCADPSHGKSSERFVPPPGAHGWPSR